MTKLLKGDKKIFHLIHWDMLLVESGGIEAENKKENVWTMLTKW